MRIAEVIGKVTLSSHHPALAGAKWILAAPLAFDEERKNLSHKGEPFVAYDELGATTGLTIAISDGAEAAAPFHPDTKPIDAYNAAILDHIELDL